MITKFLRKVRDIDSRLLGKHAPYLAGLMDGEGTFSLRVSKRGSVSFTPLISIAMTDRTTIAFAADVFGVTFTEIKSKSPHNKDAFRLLVTTRKEIREIARALLPFAITKREQIKLMLSYFALEDEKPKDKHNQRRKEILLKEIDVYIELKKRNQRGEPCDYEAMRKTLQNCITTA